MESLIYEAFGERWEVKVDREGHYGNGRVALRLLNATTSEPLVLASVNLSDRDCPAGEVWIKNYGENEGVLSWLIEHRIVDRESEAIAILPFGNVVSRHRLIRPERVRGPLDSCSNYKPLGEEE